MAFERADVTLPDAFEIIVRRTFKAPRQRVYDAWTQPEIVQAWLTGPRGWTMPVCKMDVRLGGALKWRWRQEDGSVEFGLTGIFTEVEAPARIAHTELFDESAGMGGEFLVITEFADHGAETLQTMRLIYPNTEQRDAALKTGMTDGMEAGYAKLDAVLAGVH